MLQTCASSSVGVAVGIFLLGLLLACAVGCVWHWKHRESTQLTLPRFMQRRSSRHKDCAKNLDLSFHKTGSNPKTKETEESKGHKSAVKTNKMHGHYENVEVGPPHTKGETEKPLYENTQPSNLEEHVYGNETDSLYCNFQKPNLPPAPQDEDIYILPDSY